MKNFEYIFVYKYSLILFIFVENGKVGAWDEISQALNAKKAELSQDGWGKNADSVRSSWSSRPWRGSALGPTIALLRAQSEL